MASLPLPSCGEQLGGLEQGIAGGGLAGVGGGDAAEFAHGLGAGEGEGGVFVLGFLPEFAAKIAEGAEDGEDPTRMSCLR